MKAAIIYGMGETPVYADFDAPAALAGHRLVDVRASALSRVAYAKASGKHYSSTHRFPFVAGLDGAGRLEDGQRVYFCLPRAPYGALAQQCLVAESLYTQIPDTLDDVSAAALAIPGMSSWAALVERAGFVAGETVLVNGATGVSGRLAVRIAKHLGAGKIIVTGRNRAVLDALREAGADVAIELNAEADALAAKFAPHLEAGVDVVLDYLWGASAQALLTTAARTLPDDRTLRFVQIGSASGGEIALPGAALRAAPITLLGSGIGSVAMPRLLESMRAVFGAAQAAGLAVETQAVPLAQIAQHWREPSSGPRTVFTIEA
ncbi:zinc-binding alcohol dehydrogenase family protein [Paraburkholderia sp.]|uniref:quinone oxidoreductase family protein n=1 Tax=Paraburkholderia sp. TaxID=1926495 RepID=UPI00286F5E33|nr:zinc-binding alcohol dehydrogenase family protein [Paraburkholderia sp.]